MNDYCQSEKIGAVCYHKSRENCDLCRRAHEEMERLKREMGIPSRKEKSNEVD